MSRFWNSKIVGWVENFLVNLTNYIWKKRRSAEKEIINKIKNK